MCTSCIHVHSNTSVMYQRQHKQAALLHLRLHISSSHSSTSQCYSTTAETRECCMQPPCTCSKLHQSPHVAASLLRQPESPWVKNMHQKEMARFPAFSNNLSIPWIISESTPKTFKRFLSGVGLKNKLVSLCVPANTDPSGYLQVQQPQSR